MRQDFPKNLCLNVEIKDKIRKKYVALQGNKKSWK